jgi:uncharacterized protein
MASSYELKQTKGGYMFNLKAANSKVVLTSEHYKDKAGALNGIKSVKKHAAKESNFERKSSSKGDPYFVLKASNGEIIGRSEIYKSNAACSNGIASVMKNAGIAPTKDGTAS